MTTVRRNLIATLSPQSGAPLLLQLNPVASITTATTGLVATLVGKGGAGGYAYSIISGAIPTNTALNSVTGAITTTGTLVTGEYNFVAQVQDSASSIFQHAFKIKVIGRLFIIQASPPALTINQPPAGGTNYTYFFQVGGNTGALTYALVAGAIPAGLTITGSGANAGRMGTVTTVTSVPAGGNTFFFTIRATDAGSGETIDMPTSFTLWSYMKGQWREFIDAVAGVYTYPFGTTMPPATQGVPIDYIFDATVGTAQPPFTWVWSGSATLAPDVTLTPFNGTKSCRVTLKTAAPVTNYPITLTATDSTGKVFITVTPVTPLPSVGSASLRVINAQPAFQPQLNGVSQGTYGPFTVNFAGAGWNSVTNTSGVLTVTVAQGAGGVTTINAATGAFTFAATSPIALGIVGNTFTYSHANSGVSSGTYGKVTVDARGHVTAGVGDYTTVFSIAATASVAYSHFDFASMTTATDVIRFTGAAGGASQIRGLFDSPAAGQTVMFINASTTTLTLNNQDAGEGTAAARLAIGANFAIAPDHCCLLRYDNTSARWRITASY